MAPPKKTVKEPVKAPVIQKVQATGGPVPSQMAMLKMITKDIKANASLDTKKEIKYVRARLVSYNRASVYGGYPTNVIYEIKGPNAGGKTAMGVEILASAQEAGHLTAFYDHEQAANDKSWITSLGLDLENCLYRCDHIDGKGGILTLEAAAQEINDMIIDFKQAKKDKKIPAHILLYILWDSVAAAVPSAKIVKGAKVGDANYGLTARLLSDWLQTLNALLGSSDVAVIFLNQVRSNVGAKPWEPKWKSFGGEALQFYSQLRLMVNHAGDIKEKVGGSEEVIVGRRHRFKIEKNKLGYPSQEGYFYTSNGLGECPKGFDDVRCTIEEALLQGVITKIDKSHYGSAHFEAVNGEKKLRRLLRDNPQLLANIKEEVNELILSGMAKLTSTNSEEEDEDDLAILESGEE